MRAFENCSPVEIAWAAGLFEGEGCIAFQKGKARKNGNPSKGTFVLAMKMTDLDVLQKFFSYAKVGTLLESEWYRKQGSKPQWNWRISGQPAIEVCMVLYPHFGERRKEKFMTVLNEVTESGRES